MRRWSCYLVVLASFLLLDGTLDISDLRSKAKVSNHTLPTLILTDLVVSGGYSLCLSVVLIRLCAKALLGFVVVWWRVGGAWRARLRSDGEFSWSWRVFSFVY